MNGKRMGRAASALAIVARLLSQACVLEKKTTIDAYTTVHGVPEGGEMVVSKMRFGDAHYCIPRGRASLNVKLKQWEATMTALLVTAIYTSPLLSDPLVKQFELTGKKGKFKGTFDLEEGICVNPGDKLEWRASPIGGAIPEGTSMISTFKYKAF